jgi:hypothetical protein
MIAVPEKIILTHHRALANGPYLWQGIQFYENTGFFSFCDFIEGVTSSSSTIPGASGVGLEAALDNYANWTQTQLIPGLCESYGTLCAPSRCSNFSLDSPELGGFLIFHNSYLSIAPANSLKGTLISVVQTMSPVSTHTMHRILSIPMSVSTIPTIANGIGSCAVDLDGVFPPLSS